MVSRQLLEPGIAREQIAPRVACPESEHLPGPCPAGGEQRPGEDRGDGRGQSALHLATNVGCARWQPRRQKVEFAQQSVLERQRNIAWISPVEIVGSFEPV